MEKNWLIRTKANQILGPVSLKKIKELVEKGSLKADDEVSCGDGYWFFIREEELVEKYIKNEILQGFNPVSEADSVLTALENITSEEDIMIPDEDDLEFPDLTENPKDQILEELKKESQSLPGEQEDHSPIQISSLARPKLPSVPPQKLKRVDLPPNKEKAKGSALTQNVLFIIVGFLFVLALAGFYFRKRLVKEFIDARINFFPAAYAQVIPDAVKKKLTT